MNYRIINVLDESQFSVTEGEFDLFWMEFLEGVQAINANLEAQSLHIKRRGYFYVGGTQFKNFRERSLGYRTEKKIDELLKQ